MSESQRAQKYFYHPADQKHYLPQHKLKDWNGTIAIPLYRFRCKPRNRFNIREIMLKKKEPFFFTLILSTIVADSLIKKFQVTSRIIFSWEKK